MKLSSPPQQHNSRPRNQLVDYRRHRYHRNLCYRLQATSPSSLFEIFLGDVRVMSFVARPISSMPAQILHSFLTVKPVCLTLTAHAIILHDPPVCIFNVVHVELRIVLLFFHLHTNQLSNLLCIFRCSCSGPYSASQIFPSSPEKLDRLKTWAIGRDEASKFLWIYGLNSIQTSPVSFLETNEILLPWDTPIFQMNCLSLLLSLSSATSWYIILPSSSSTFNCLHPCIRS